MFWNRITARGDNPGTGGPFAGRPLGRILIKMGKLTREQLVAALNDQKSRGGLLGEVLIRRGDVTAVEVETALTAQRGDAPAG